MPLQIVVSNAIGAFQGLVGGGPGPGPGPGPLPSGFAAGYSVRKLSSSYSGSALRVRRTVAPFDEQDIGFDSNGDLDTAAITTFGGSDSLTVSRWYDQSGNLFDVTQGTATAQPTIFDGTAVITVNGKPAVSFDGNDKLLYTGITNTDLVTADGHASSVVFKDTSTSGFKGVIGTDDRAIDFVTRLGNTDWQYSITTNNTPELQYTASASNYNVQNLSFVNKGAVNAYWRLNASQIASNLGGGVVTPGTTNWEVGESVGLKYQGLLQEVVVWNTDNDSNAAGIESNINTYYSIYPTSGLLYDYPGAAAAYSVRSLSNNAIKCMRVRRTVAPFDEQDIGFDSNGDLDTAAIASFGGSDPLTVSAWYDQSGQSRHATQATATSQPSIYDGAAVITENGKAILSGGVLQYSTITYTNSVHSTFYICRFDANAIYASGSGSGTGQYQAVHRGGVIFERIGGLTTYHPTASTATTNAQHLISILDDATTTTSSVDGTSGTVSSAGTWTAGVTLTHRGEYGLSPDVKIQELVIYDSDESTNRTGIESNINGYYGVYTMYNPDAPTSGLLYDYSGAAVAYSVRQLNNNATYAMRVRRTVAPFDEQDIGFDSNGELDTSAISTFGGSDPLTVSRWYDQTGNQNHATQGTAGNQPTIYDGAAVITENGKPAIDNDGTGGDHFVLNTGLGNVSTYTVFTVLEYGIRNTVSGEASMLFAKGASDWLWYQNVSTINVNATGSSRNITTTWSTSQRLDYHALDSGTASFGTNSSTLDTVGSVSGGVPMDYILGHYGTAGQYNYNGKAQELIIYTSNQSSNRTGIESNVNTYYSIYHTSGFLVDYPGALGAWSIRRLGNTQLYSMRIRRDSDSAETDIGFDSNGDLDTQAIVNFCTGTTGKAIRLYDQTKQGRDLIGTSSTGPVVYTGGALVTDGNGDFAMELIAGTADAFYLPGTQPSIAINNMAMFTVTQNTVTAGNNYQWATAQGPTILNLRSHQMSYAGTTSPQLSGSFTNPRLTTMYADSASNEVKFFVNGTEDFSTTPVSGTFSDAVRFGRGPNNSSDGGGYLKEYILYDRSTKADQSAMTSNINAYYSVYTEYNPDAPTSGFLFDYSGASVAYSVRQLNNNATVALRVRRTVAPFDEQDIGFDGSGNLDTSAISTFGGSDSLTVSRWYDQTGNQNHATQGTAGSQPQIYDGAAVITENGKAAIEFSGSESLGRTDSVHSGTGAMSAQAVFTRSTTFSNGLYQLGSGSLAQFNWTNEWGYRVNGGNRLFSTSSPVAGTQVLASTYIASPASTSTTTLFINGTSVSATSTNSQNFDIANNLTSIGANYTNFGGGHFNGVAQELVFWSSDETSNRTGIESNINTYFSIY